VTSIKGTVKSRRLEVAVADDWPDGIEVEIHPLEPSRNADSMSVEEIARTLAAMELIEPLEWTEAERTAWEAERQARKEFDKAQFAEQAERLRRQWE
jgi:hypothetical protein